MYKHMDAGAFVVRRSAKVKFISVSTGIHFAKICIAEMTADPTYYS